MATQRYKSILLTWKRNGGLLRNYLWNEEKKKKRKKERQTNELLLNHAGQRNILQMMMMMMQNMTLFCAWPYHSAGLVVVKVHHGAEVTASLHHVDELARELAAEPDVVAAAAPLPVLAARTSLLVLVVARARAHTTLSARAGHGVRDRRTGDSVDKSCLSGTWNMRLPGDYYFILCVFVFLVWMSFFLIFFLSLL